MRLLRVLAVATGFAALVSHASAAQDGRQFKDAWFWGVKTGAVSFSSATTTNGGAPLIGAEWLITRTHGGLYVSFDQAFLTTTGGFGDRDPDSSFTRFVQLKNMRRVTIAGMAFPIERGNLHPYAGFGLSFNQIASPTLLSSTTNPARYAIILDSVQTKKASFSPILLAGVQARYRPFSAFVQGSMSPTQQTFFLYNQLQPTSFVFSLEMGVRYNVGSSIDRAR
ncbi:MAG: hypothetical protein ABJE47_15230 [bacterium]